jgi:hypothetical protein
MARAKSKPVSTVPNWFEDIRNWKLDADREDDLARFYMERDAVTGLTNGHKVIVTGRKGTGKTAIVRYVAEQAATTPNHYTARVTLQNYGVFGEDPTSVKDTGGTTDLHPHWSLVILTELSKLLLQNSRVPNNEKAALKELVETSPIRALRGYERIPEERGAELKLMGHGGGFTSRDKIRFLDIDVAERTRTIKDAVLRAIDNSFYYVMIDGIDSNFTPVSNYLGEKYFYDYVSSFIRAAESLRHDFRRADKRFFPIVTVRSDIYGQLKHADKGKWRDIKVDLVWSEDALKQLVDLRVARAQEDRIRRFETMGYFEKMFLNKTIDGRSLYKHAVRLSFRRPRDIVNFVQCAAENATSFPIPNTQLRKIFRSHAEYLKQEIVDESHTAFPDVDDFLQVIEQAGKSTVNHDLFKQMFASSHGIATEEAIELAVKYNILGVVRGKAAVYAYEDEAIKPLPRYELEVHPGLRPLLTVDD